MIPMIVLGMDNAEDRLFMETAYLDYRHLMYRIAMKILKNPNDAEDAINDACESLIKKVELLRQLSERNLYYYIVTTIRNTAVNRVIKRGRDNRYTFLCTDENPIESIPDRAHPIDAHIIQQNELDELIESLRKLPLNELNLLQMKYLNDQTDIDIARTLGVKPQSVRMYLTRARRHAVALLKEGK